MRSIYDFSRQNLENYLILNNQKKFRATQVFEAIYRQNHLDFDSISNFSKDAKVFFNENFYFSKLEIKDIKISTDKTTKFLFALEDGNLIETVLMPHNYGNSVCVTTQVGCNMGCKFCASGTLKKIRNLTTAEIVLQVLTINNYLANEGKRVTNVVIMGIGEPFDNYDNVMEFIRVINDEKGLEIGSRHITLSTAGLVPRIYDFSDFPLQVNLAISLHFANNELRNKYMPINKSYDLDKLFEALKYYYQKTNRRITFEYILLDSINDSLADALELANLVKNINCYVNLIPYNETNGFFRRSSEEKRHQFFDYLMKQGINAIIRREFGHDIDAACGQLRAKKMMENK